MNIRQKRVGLSDVSVRRWSTTIISLWKWIHNLCRPERLIQRSTPFLAWLVTVAYIYASLALKLSSSFIIGSTFKNKLRIDNLQHTSTFSYQTTSSIKTASYPYPETFHILPELISSHEQTWTLQRCHWNLHNNLLQTTTGSQFSYLFSNIR